MTEQQQQMVWQGQGRDSGHEGGEQAFQLNANVASFVPGQPVASEMSFGGDDRRRRHVPLRQPSYVAEHAPTAQYTPSGPSQQPRMMPPQPVYQDFAQVQQPKGQMAQPFSRHSKGKRSNSGKNNNDTFQASNDLFKGKGKGGGGKKDGKGRGRPRNFMAEGEVRDDAWAELGRLRRDGE